MYLLLPFALFAVIAGITGSILWECHRDHLDLLGQPKPHYDAVEGGSE